MDLIASKCTNPERYLVNCLKKGAKLNLQLHKNLVSYHNIFSNKYRYCTLFTIIFIKNKTILSTAQDNFFFFKCDPRNQKIGHPCFR